MIIRIAATRHVETVVSLSHKKVDIHINVNMEFGDEEGQMHIDEIAKKAEEYRYDKKATYWKYFDETFIIRKSLQGK